MATLTQNFENGTNGTTVTPANSGGGSNSAFDATAGPPSGGTLAYSNTEADTGSLALKVATGTTAGACLVQWQASVGTQTQIWFRVYLYFTANPSSNLGVVQILNGASQCAELFVLSTGQLRMVNAASGTITTSTAAIPLNQWCRVECMILASTTVGQTEVKLFKTAQSTTADETNTSAATQVLAAQITRVYFGLVNAGLANVTAYYLDDLGVTSVGYLGPVQFTGAATAVLAVAASAAGAKRASGSPSAVTAFAAAGTGSKAGRGNPSAVTAFAAPAAGAKRGDGSPVAAVTFAASATGRVVLKPVNAGGSATVSAGTMSSTQVSQKAAAVPVVSGG